MSFSNCWFTFMLFLFFCLSKMFFRIGYLTRNFVTCTIFYLYFSLHIYIRQESSQATRNSETESQTRYKFILSHNSLDEQTHWSTAAAQCQGCRFPLFNCSAILNCGFCLLIKCGCPSSNHHLHVHACILSHSVMSDSSQPHGLQPARLLSSWDFTFSQQEQRKG